MSFFCPKGFHNNSRLLHSLLTALLWVLLVLNIYWGILLVKMGLWFLTVRELKDMQHEVRASN
jgi:hypothetical protein